MYIYAGVSTLFFITVCLISPYLFEWNLNRELRKLEKKYGKGDAT